MPSVPLIESPLFPLLAPSLGMSAEEACIADDLFHKGFAVFDFSDPELDARIDHIQGQLGPRFGVDFADPDSNKTAGERRIQDAWQEDTDVRAIAANQRVLELLGTLYGRPFRSRR